MTVTVFDQPYPLVDLESAKVALGEYSDDRNVLISGLILAAQGEMDGPNGWLGMCVARQGLEYVVDDFSETIALPFGPVIEPVEVYYRDVDGAERVLPSSDYSVSAQGELRLASGARWPSVSSIVDAVRIRYYAGIADTFDPRIEMLKTAILMHVRMTLDGVEAEASRRALESIVRPMWVARC